MNDELRAATKAAEDAAREYREALDEQQLAQLACDDNWVSTSTARLLRAWSTLVATTSALRRLEAHSARQ